MWWTILFNIIPLIIKLIPLAEDLFGNEAKSGEKKKEFVMGTSKAIVDGLTIMSTGGQKETWERLAEPISWIIDAACGLLFPKGK